MSNIAIIGDMESILGFKALGLDVYPANDFESGKAVLDHLAKEATAIILITEDLAMLLTAEIKTYEDQLIPAIVLIPGVSGSKGLGLQQISTRVKKAVGMDILKERNEVST